MAKCFAVKFLSGYPKAERETLIERIDSQSFMPLPTYTTTNQAEFLFADDTLTAEKLRKIFGVPAECEVFDTTPRKH